MFRIYVVKDGVVIWYGERGLPKRLVYRTFKGEEYKIFNWGDREITIKELTRKLKDDLDFEKSKQEKEE